MSDATATTTEYAPNTTNTTLNVKSNSESPTVPTATTSTTGDKEKASLMHADTPAASKLLVPKYLCEWLTAVTDYGRESPTSETEKIVVVLSFDSCAITMHRAFQSFRH